MCKSNTKIIPLSGLWLFIQYRFATLNHLVPSFGFNETINKTINKMLFYEIILILFLYFDRNVLLLCNHVVNQDVYKLCFNSVIFIIIWKDIIILLFAILILRQVFDCLLVVLPSFKINKNEHDINVCVIFSFFVFSTSYQI